MCSLPSVDGGLGLALANDEEGRVRSPAASVRESFELHVRDAGVRLIRRRVFFARVRRRRWPSSTRRSRRGRGGTICTKTRARSSPNLSVDVDKQKSTVIWRRQNLPSSSLLTGCSPPKLGGVLVFSQDFLLHESRESSSVLGLNTFGRGGPQEGNDAEVAARAAGMGENAGESAADARSRRGLWIGNHVDGAQASVVSEDRVLVTTKTGALLLLALHTDGRNLRRMMLQRVGGRAFAGHVLARERFTIPRKPHR